MCRFIVFEINGNWNLFIIYRVFEYWLLGVIVDFKYVVWLSEYLFFIFGVNGIMFFFLIIKDIEFVLLVKEGVDIIVSWFEKSGYENYYYILWLVM